MTVAKLLDPEGNYNMVEGAAPVEFLLERVRGPSSTINQTEIPRDLPTFAAFIRGCMRREPTDIIVGECRDSETMDAAIQAAISGHVLTTTVHANDVPLTMQRIASLCPPAERENLISAVAQSLRLVINQRLARSTDGRRTALREFLVFDARLRGHSCATEPSEWPALTRRAVEEQGQSYRARHRACAGRGPDLRTDSRPRDAAEIGVSMWRNTGQPVRLLMLDARACLPILSFVVYWSWPPSMSPSSASRSSRRSRSSG